MTIRWFSDADRQAMREAERDHAELRQVLAALWDQHCPPHVITEEEKRSQPPVLSTLKIDPHRRTLSR